MCFQRFLLQARTTLGRYLSDKRPISLETERKLHLVLGNESCDLDSAVSALTLAFIYAQRQQEHDFVPVLNIPRLDYPLKTEVDFMLSKCDIKQESLIFRDDLPVHLGGDIRVILVDHHISHWAAHVVEILDHRPLDEGNSSLQLLPAHCQRQIEAEVGSCATLVGERYLSVEQPRSSFVAELLHATIVLDTINFQPAAKRYSARDLAMVEQLEQQLGQQPAQQRAELFEQLVAARADTSKLTLNEVLRKDMKQLETERHRVPLAGLPMLVRDFIEQPDAEQAIRQFAEDSNLLVILGMFVPPEKEDGATTQLVQRDVALISLTGQSQLVERVRLALVNCQDPDLQLRPHAIDTHFMGGCFMRQHNIQATRKHILPIIRRVMLDWEAIQHCDCDDVYFFKEKPKLGLS